MKNQSTVAAAKPAIVCQSIEKQVDRLLSRLDGVKNTGRDKWLALCPGHDDRSPSLAVKQCDDRVLVHCFAGCGIESVLAAIGLTFSVLFPDKSEPRYHGINGYDRYKARKSVPRFRPSELYEIAVQEAGILAIGFDDVRQGRALCDADLERVQRAYSTVMELVVEVSR